MSGVCNWAQRQQFVPTNVAKLARVPAGVSERHDSPTVEQLGALIVVADQVSASAGMLVRIAAATGARCGELAACGGLMWTRIDSWC